MNKDRDAIELKKYYYSYSENETQITVEIAKVFVLEETHSNFFRVYTGEETTVVHIDDLYRTFNEAIIASSIYYTKEIEKAKSTLKRLDEEYQALQKKEEVDFESFFVTGKE